MTSAVSVQDKKQYHHGDLRNTLLLAATEMLVDGGIEGLSLRKLADRVGVSRTAPYHHFKDKSALLCGIAQEGFKRWQSRLNAILDCTELNDAEKHRAMVKVYLYYASENPEIYELMFGRTIWQNQAATNDLKEVAFPCFQFQVTMTRYWQDKGLLPNNQDALRLAQVTWGTLHGIARLLIDGIYADSSHIEEMCDCAADLFMQKQMDAYNG